MEHVLQQEIDNLDEIWKPIVGWEGLYEVSNLGNVKSIDRYILKNNGNTSLYKGKSRLSFINCRGYVEFILNYKNRHSHYTQHRLVATAFIPKVEGKPEVNHIDGNKLNNRVDNLEWCTRSENNQHAYNTGLREIKVGKDWHMSKLNEQDVLAIRCSELSDQKLSEKFKVSRACIIKIRNRKTWKHLPLNP